MASTDQQEMKEPQAAEVIGTPHQAKPTAEGAGTADQQKAVDKIAAGGKPDGNEYDAALEWLLADDVDEQEARKTVEFNVGDGDEERWIKWEIKPVDQNLLRELNNPQGNRRQRRAGGIDVDVSENELRIVVHGTASPDLKKAAAAKGISAPDPMYGPMEIVRHRFRYKPGFITQLVGHILDLSGFDEADMREAQAMKVAGNSSG